jgi:hypothetical protein
MSARPEAVENFRQNLKAVEDLITFDRQVYDFLSASLTSLKTRLKKYEIDNPYLQPDKLITMVEQLREGQALGRYYKAMYNQCLVLTVSHFASGVRELFVEGIAAAAARGSEQIADEVLKVKVEHLLDETVDRHILVAETIADSSDNSWQDMQSIGRAFAKYFGESPERDEITNNIIVAQAVRHVIVHAGAMVDRRLLSQIKKANPREFNPSLVIDQPIQLTPEDVRLCGRSMLTYLERLAYVVHKAAI